MEYDINTDNSSSWSEGGTSYVGQLYAIKHVTHRTTPVTTEHATAIVYHSQRYLNIHTLHMEYTHVTT